MGTEVPKVRGSPAYDQNQMPMETAGWMSAIGETQKSIPLLGGGTSAFTHSFKRGFFCCNRECPAQAACVSLSFCLNFQLPIACHLGIQQAAAELGAIGLDLANSNIYNDFAKAFLPKLTGVPSLHTSRCRIRLENRM